MSANSTEANRGNATAPYDDPPAAAPRESLVLSESATVEACARDYESGANLRAGFDKIAQGG